MVSIRHVIRVCNMSGMLDEKAYRGIHELRWTMEIVQYGDTWGASKTMIHFLHVAVSKAGSGDQRCEGIVMAAY